MRPSAKVACLALLACMSCAGPPQEPGADGLVPYAQMKADARQIVPRGALKWTCHTRFPARGVVVGYGGFGTRQANFYIVDIDRRTIRRIMVDWDPSPKGQAIRDIDMRQVVWFDRSMSLSLEELNPVIRRMNHIWRDGVSDRAELQLLDSAPALVLLDGGLVFEDSGTAIHAPDKVLAAAVYDLAQQHKLTLARGTPTDAPCDPGSAA